MAVQLSAKWQLDAALLSRPVDLTSLVSLSRTHPEKFVEDDTIHRLVSKLLNETNSSKSDKDTKLDVLNILANVAGGDMEAKAEVRVALGGISEWFDEYIVNEEADATQEPELHKAMVLLLARCWNYKLKTEDVLELTQGNRQIALCTVVGLLEDGETYTTSLKQRKKPQEGQMAQWEHELNIHRFEKPLLMQVCRLLRGFTHPGTYFEASTDELALYSVERFSSEINTLLEITLRSRLVEKLCVAMYSCLFDEVDENGQEVEDIEQRVLEDTDHMAVMSVHAFLQNLYFYASHNHDEFRRHMLVDTLLIPRLILPYLNCCVQEAMMLNNRADAYEEVLDGDRVGDMALDNKHLVKGMAASIRTLIISSFRAPATQYVMSLLRRLNPTASILRASSFCKRHHQIYSLLCLLNVNMGALDLSRTYANDSSVVDAYRAHALLHEMASLFSEIDKTAQAEVYRRVISPGSLPITRDTPSYVAVMSVLHGGAAGQLDYIAAVSADGKDGEDEEAVWDSRAEAKKAHAERMALARQAVEEAESKSGSGKKPSAFEVAIQAAQDIEDRRVEAKEAKATGGDRKDNKGNNVAESKSDQQQIRGDGYRLLGDLPSLSGGSNARDVQVALALELPGESTKPVPKMVIGGREVAAAASSDSDIPTEFLCVINGHMMKDPVRCVRTGLVFEKATIEIWLKTRGSVCPITLEPLTLEDLEPDHELRKRIMRHHIQNKSRAPAKLKQASSAEDDDDLYDF